MNIEQAVNLGKKSILSDSAQLDAEILLGFVLKKSRTYLYTWPEKTLSPEEHEAYTHLVLQRSQGQPVAHLTQEREFWGLTLKVNQHTLIPRPDTEILVEAALNQLTKLGLTSPRVLDLGTGSGAIICALKHERPNIQAFAVEQQPDALLIAKKNADTHQLDISFFQGSWFEPLENKVFDIIISNPPYIEENDPHLTEGDVRFEPITALTSGNNGLKDIEFIIKTTKSRQNNLAWLLIEHGYNQAEAVHGLFDQYGYTNIELIHDYGNQPRVTLAQLN